MKHTDYTPGPWRYTKDGRVFGCCAHEWNASLNMETAPFVAAGTRKQADLDLIADAPRLAEENERLRGLLAGLLAEYSTHNEHNAYQMYSGDLAAIKAALAGRESKG